MTGSPDPGRGRIITYLDASEGGGWFCRAVVAGVSVADPDNDLGWLPIVRPDGELTLLDPAVIVPAGPDPVDPVDPPPAVDLLAGALAMLAEEMSELDERSPTARQAAQDLLARFVDVITPIEASLRGLVDIDPQGGLATVLGCIDAAAGQLDRGHVSIGKHGIVIANEAMADLVEPEE